MAASGRARSFEELSPGRIIDARRHGAGKANTGPLPELFVRADTLAGWNAAASSCFGWIGRGAGVTGQGRDRVDIILVGGGLANGLIAWRLAASRPDIRLLVLEAGGAVGGNHTWSFHDGDLTAAERDWLAPFIVHRWPAYGVRFPERVRELPTGYASVTAERFAAVLGARLGPALRCNAAVATVTPTAITLADGERIEAGCVIDGRGPAPSRHLTLGYQKFLGQEIELAAPHGLTRPIIMDATIPQEDGYRFVYTLPLGPCRLLVEDTYYADGPTLEPGRLRTAIGAYLARQGWTAEALVREEAGVLPIALGGDIDAFWAERTGVPASGLAAALFHPTTGYSLPDAVRLADRIASLTDLSSEAVFEATRAQSVAAWNQRGFFRLLNRLLFLAGAPAERHRILQHFYRLPPPLVSRFYAGKLKPFDKLRILSGKPPVSVHQALRVLAQPAHSPKVTA